MPTQPPFDPERGTTVVEPLGSGPGWWAGAPSALWSGGRFYLSYRLRRPRPERGGSTHIAVSDDGVRFETIWTAQKEEFDTPSIERSALVHVADRHWRLYVSYVDAADGRWRIDLLEGAAPDRFDPRQRRPVLTAADIGAEGVKDPWVARRDGGWQLLASYVDAPPHGTGDRSDLHGTMDVFTTGLTTSSTGIATSDDGLTWRWAGAVLTPSAGGWDSYTARLTSVVATADGWLGFYDGCGGVEQNYEERCGLVIGDGADHWSRASARPAVGAPGGTGTVRYVEAVQTTAWIRFFYEFTRPDGSHELRTSLRETRP
ncbi:hypothetical protein [Jiangella asiatica]|uniref:Uncharacterized protein n=1 Tax=Jiangella asiatica TaxID=2530372 RepID=A0A4R5DGY7_9ACTN|nr:hypothetical protein [Jiangella asiatica]TDE11181.1 hypothetical protein E1269_09925 [Jiangella asiatica]